MAVQCSVLSFHYFQSIGSPQWPSANGQNPARSDNASRAGPHGVQPPVSRQLSQQNFSSYSVNGFVYLITVSCGERDGSKPRTNELITGSNYGAALYILCGRSTLNGT